MRVTLIDTDAGVEALGAEWESLWRRCPHATPFQSPAWLLPWWRCFGTGAPRVAALREHGELAGVLACYVLDEPGCRKLLPIGAGITDYQDVLLAPGVGEDASGALLSVVLARALSDHVACCDLTDLPPNAVLRGAPKPPDWREEFLGADACPVLGLPANADGTRAIPAHMRRNLRLALNRATRAGGWSAEVAADDSTLSALLDTLETLHAARWRACGQRGVLADPPVARFHRLAAPLLLASGTLRLQALRLGGKLAAVYYALLAGTDRILFYLSGFDPAFARASPGTILLSRMIEDAVREGRRELHFLRGGEAYKYAWGGVDRMNATRRLLPP